MKVGEQMQDKAKKEISRSVDNAIRIIECYAEKEERGISELARELDLSKASVARIVASLERGKFLMQNPDTGKYRLGVGMMLYGYLARDRNELANALTPAMQSIAHKYQSTTHLATLIGSELMIINKISAGPFVYMSSRVGGTLHAHATAVGKCILAYLDEAKQQEYFSNAKLDKLTEKTITDREQLNKVLMQIRKDGYSVDDEEAHDGLYCIAVPVFDVSKKPIAALSVSGRKELLSARKKEIVEDLYSTIKESIG